MRYCYAVNCGNKASKPHYRGWCNKHGDMFVQTQPRYTAEELVAEARLVRPEDAKERLGVTRKHVLRQAKKLGVTDLWKNY